MLKEWYSNEYSTLKKIDKEIEKIERDQKFYKQLDELRSAYLEQWLDEGHLNDVVREDINKTLQFIPESQEEDKDRLKQLKAQKESIEFVLKKLKALI